MKPMILVVDDQDDERDAMTGLLAQSQFEVEAVTNGQEALDRLWQEGSPLPVLMVMDLNMPVMDGWELLSHLAHDRSLREIPVIVTSASPVVHEAVVVPANVTFLAKPLRAGAVLHAIADLMTSPASDGVPVLPDEAADSDDVDTERHVARSGRAPSRVA
jgi:chemosensory pili system protein ChpA (sensor histidine kinase/response regulator)